MWPTCCHISTTERTASSRSRRSSSRRGLFGGDKKPSCDFIKDLSFRLHGTQCNKDARKDDCFWSRDGEYALKAEGKYKFSWSGSFASDERIKIKLYEKDALVDDYLSLAADREAAVFPEQDVRWTWAELEREVDALAHGFLKLGLEKGDRVGIWSPNRYEWLLTQFATARVGIIHHDSCINFFLRLAAGIRISNIEQKCNTYSEHHSTRQSTARCKGRNTTRSVK